MVECKKQNARIKKTNLVWSDFMDKNLYELSERIHYTKPDESTDRPILALISGSKYSLMVDAGASPDHTNNFINRILEQKLAYPDFCVLTHWHWDHSFGASALTCPLISHEISAKELLAQKEFAWDNISIAERVAKGLETPMIKDHLIVEYPDENREIVVRIPDILFSDSMEIDLGGIRCIIKKIGGDHSLDSTIIYIPEEKTVFLGDSTFYNLHTKTPLYNPENVIPLFKYLLSLEAEYFFFSHDEYPSSREAFVEYADVIINLAKATNIITEKDSIIELREAYSELAGTSLPDEDLDLAEAFLKK